MPLEVEEGVPFYDGIGLIPDLAIVRYPEVQITALAGTLSYEKIQQ